LAAKHNAPENGDTEKVANLIGLIDRIDAEGVRKNGDEWAIHQPFLISLLIGDSKDLLPEEFEEGMKCYMLIWGYFKDRKGIRQKAITQTQYSRILERNLRMVQYMGDEPTERAATKVVESDIENLMAKALFVGVQLRFERSAAIQAMDSGLRGQYLLCMKSLIECFEELEK
jgi:hypothetical protein